MATFNFQKSIYIQSALNYLVIKTIGNMFGTKLIWEIDMVVSFFVSFQNNCPIIVIHAILLLPNQNGIRPMID